MFGVHAGYSYLRWSSLAEKSLLCLARYWILALGMAPSAEAETGHIGSWSPQLSFSLINEKMKSFQYGAAMMKTLVQRQSKYFPSGQLPNERMILSIKCDPCSFSHCLAPFNRMFKACQTSVSNYVVYRNCTQGRKHWPQRLLNSWSRFHTRSMNKHAISYDVTAGTEPVLRRWKCLRAGASEHVMIM